MYYMPVNIGGDFFVWSYRHCGKGLRFVGNNRGVPEHYPLVDYCPDKNQEGAGGNEEKKIKQFGFSIVKVLTYSIISFNIDSHD